MISKNLNQKIYLSIKEVVKNGPKDLHIPKLGNKEILYLKKCVKSNMVSSIGSFTYDFENRIGKVTGSKNDVLMLGAAF